MHCLQLPELVYMYGFGDRLDIWVYTHATCTPTHAIVRGEICIKPSSQRFYTMVWIRSLIMAHNFSQVCIHVKRSSVKCDEIILLWQQHECQFHILLQKWYLKASYSNNHNYDDLIHNVHLWFKLKCLFAMIVWRCSRQHRWAPLHPGSSPLYSQHKGPGGEYRHWSSDFAVQ